MKYFIVILIILSDFLFAQVNDSTKSFNRISKDSTKTDTSKNVLADSLKHITVIDTVIPLHQKSLAGNSFIIPRTQINYLDYRYAGDLLKPFDFYFTRDQGFVGQPNEVTVYGAGFNGVSFLEDGILFNNRLTNSLDLNQIQTEYIDSIEIVPLPRGFLYSPYNNNVSVNFITRDFLSRPPYSRIKFYQGPNGESFVDGLFNAWMYKKFNASFDITNRKTDSSYTNSSFSLWQVRLKLKYLLSDKINIIGNYYFVTSQEGLNGGVDYAKLDSTNINSVLYDQQLAPVVYPNRYEQTKQQNYSIRLLGKFTDFSNTDLTLYYRSNFDAISGGTDSTYFVNTDRNKIYGASLRQDFTSGLFNVSLNGNYENYDLNYDALYDSLHPTVSYNSSVYSVSAIATFESENKMFVPSIFYKTSHNSYYSNDPNSSAYGMDINLNLFSSLSLYAGYSFYNNQSNSDTKNFEVSAEFKNDKLMAGLRYFSVRDYYTSNYPIQGPNPSPLPIIFSSVTQVSFQNTNGLGGHLNFKFWKIEVENSAAYYFDPDNSANILSSVPKYTYRGGVYYRDILFSGNLNLKTGIVFYYNGERRSKINYSSLPIVSSNNRFDFTLTGEIQKVAIVYLTWENLFNNQYFIVPYYPMPSRNIRFGIAWELFN